MEKTTPGKSRAETPGQTDGAAADETSGSNAALLAVLYLCAFVAAFNENVVNVALVDIMAEFSVASTTAQLLATGYMAVSAIAVSIVAYLLNRFSLRRLFFFGTGILVLGSVVDAVAPNFAILLVARLAQASGTGIFISMMMNTVLILAPRRRLASYLAIGSCCITFGPAFGPVVSGIMVTCFGWRSIFALVAACMLVLMIAGAFVVRPVGETHGGKLDIASVALSICGLTLLVAGLSTIADLSVQAIACAVAGVAFIAVFARRQFRIENPVLNLGPMRRPAFSIAIVLIVVCMMISFSLSVLLPLYFQGAGGTTALVAGMLLLVPILLNAFAALAGGRIMDRFGEWPLLPIGYALIFAGMVMCCMVAGQLNMMLVVAAASIANTGIGLVTSNTQTSGLKRLPRELNSYGVAIINTSMMIAASMGPSLFVSIMSSGSDAQMAAGVRETLAQAVGFTHAAWIGAGIAAAGLVVALVYTLYAVKKADARAEAERTARAAVPVATAADAFKLEAVMKRDAYCIEKGARVCDAVQIMLLRKTSGLPIVDGQGSVVGFVSDGDILKSLAARSNSGSFMPYTVSMAVFSDDAEFDERLKDLMTADVMTIATRNVVSIDIGQSIEDACATLGDRRIKKAPVLEDGKLVGTVSRADVTRVLMRGFLEKEESLEQRG